MAFLPLARGLGRGHDAGMQAEVVLYDGFDELDALAPWEVLDGVAKGIGDLDIALVSLDGAGPITAARPIRSCAWAGANAPETPSASINAMKNLRYILFSKINSMPAV